MSLDEFKAVQIAKLMHIKQQYSDNDRVSEIVDLYLLPKLYHLRAMDLADYIFTLYLASREFSIFEELIPSEENVEQLIKDKNKLYYFKVKYLARLIRLRKELKAKYPVEADRIENIVFEIAPKLANLRRHTLTDYLFTATLACREFSELCKLIPSEQEIKTLVATYYE
jgi:hypothetical protein